MNRSSAKLSWQTNDADSRNFEIHHLETFANFINTTKIAESSNQIASIPIIKKSCPPFLPVTIFADMTSIDANIRLTVFLAFQVWSHIFLYQLTYTNIIFSLLPKHIWTILYQWPNLNRQRKSLPIRSSLMNLLHLDNSSNLRFILEKRKLWNVSISW